MKPLISILLTLGIMTFLGCNQASQNQASQQEAQAGKPAAATPAPSAPTLSPPYVIADSSQVQMLEGGVQLYVIEKGNGVVPKLQNNVVIHYHGMLTDGTVFDSSFDRGQVADFSLQQLIKGWQVGMTQVPTGSRIKLVIPPEYGYGAAGSGKVPPNATLIFDIDLITAY